MTSSEPPPFQEANRCDVCKCSFTTFRRRHHCRCCGRTLCYEHSSNQMPLPQFGIHAGVRVCADCFNDSSRINFVTQTVSRLDISEDSDDKDVSNVPQEPASINSECKCGMPLCICVTASPSNEAAPLEVVSTSTTSLNPRPKKEDTTLKNKRSTIDGKQSSSSGIGQSVGVSEKPKMDYEVNGEGAREAIKNGDVAGVKDLLSKDVDSNYCDKQGFSLLHLAALFNQTDIAFTLMEHGARVDYKNPQGETPLDCAPATLQYKMRKKMEEGSR